MLRGVQAGPGADVAEAVVARHAAATERGQDYAAQAADAGAGRGVPGQGEEEEKVPGEEERAEGCQNAVGHPADVHHHVDAVQHTGAAQAVHGDCPGRRRRTERQQGVGDAGRVGLLLLPVLHQQHHQPGVLRPVQRHVPHDLRAHTQVQVEHPQATAAALPRVNARRHVSTGRFHKKVNDFSSRNRARVPIVYVLDWYAVTSFFVKEKTKKKKNSKTVRGIHTVSLAHNCTSVLYYNRTRRDLFYIVLLHIAMNLIYIYHT